SLRGFAGGTFIGVIPLSLHNVWLGSIAADLSLAGVRDAGRSPVEWTLYVAGFLATVVLVLYLNRLARHALARYRRDDMQGGA
ncbi:MAG: hypothetical protein R3308_07035, partial [Thiohalobacterales bacterium]|nr:hypothetical protein [Thiohalobacterales bacterium]